MPESDATSTRKDDYGRRQIDTFGSRLRDHADAHDDFSDAHRTSWQLESPKPR